MSFCRGQIKKSHRGGQHEKSKQLFKNSVLKLIKEDLAA